MPNLTNAPCRSVTIPFQLLRWSLLSSLLVSLFRYSGRGLEHDNSSLSAYDFLRLLHDYNLSAFVRVWSDFHYFSEVMRMNFQVVLLAGILVVLVVGLFVKG